MNLFIRKLTLSIRRTVVGAALFGGAMQASTSVAPQLSSSEPQRPPASKPAQRVHQCGRIRVFYHTEGPHGVDPLDANHNNIPDQVEDILTQTEAANQLFVQVLGFPDPFRTARYRSASVLDIHLRNKEVLKSNGVAYDELQRFNRASDPRDTLSLCFNVATSVKAASNLTPAHEFFHVIQNSVTFFKNRWFTEGTARWSERGLGLGAIGPTRDPGPLPLPLAPEKADALFAMAYEASEHFWNPLAAQADAVGLIPESPELEKLQALTYVDGTPVLKDLRLTGWRWMREVLHALDAADDVAFRELGYDRWSEENQKSPRNNPFIMTAICEVMNRLGKTP